MNRYKLFFIILFIFVLTGCQANYNIKIMLNDEVKEKVTLIDKKENILDDFTVKGFKNYIDESLRLNNLESIIKNKTLIFEKNRAGVNLEKEYKNIIDYKQNSKAISYLFKDIKIEKNDNKTIIKTIASDYELDLDDNYENSTISISLPFKVISSNADRTDNKNNTLTWNIDDDFKGIEIEYSNSKLYTYNITELISFATIENYINIFIIVIIIIFLITILVLGSILLIRDKNDH